MSDKSSSKKHKHKSKSKPKHDSHVYNSNQNLYFINDLVNNLGSSKTSSNGEIIYYEHEKSSRYKNAEFDAPRSKKNLN